MTYEKQHGDEVTVHNSKAHIFLGSVLPRFLGCWLVAKESVYFGIRGSLMIAMSLGILQTGTLLGGSSQLVSG